MNLSDNELIKFEDGAYILIVNIVGHVTRFPLVVHSLPPLCPSAPFSAGQTRVDLLLAEMGTRYFFRSPLPQVRY